MLVKGLGNEHGSAAFAGVLQGLAQGFEIWVAALQVMTAVRNIEVDLESTIDFTDVADRETKRLEQLRDETRVGIDLYICGLSRVVEVLQNLRPDS